MKMESTAQTILEEQAKLNKGIPTGTKGPAVGSWLAVVVLSPAPQVGIPQNFSFVFDSKESGENFVREVKETLTAKLLSAGWKIGSTVLTQNTTPSPEGGTPNPAQAAAGLAQDRGRGDA